MPIVGRNYEKVVRKAESLNIYWMLGLASIEFLLQWEDKSVYLEVLREGFFSNLASNLDELHQSTSNLWVIFPDFWLPPLISRVHKTTTFG